MDATNSFIKFMGIAFLVVVITMLHYSTVGSHTDLHIIYREFYFLPILLSCIWFGLYHGLVTALVISLFYAPHVFIYKDAHGSMAAVSVQILVFIVIAFVVGLLVNRQRKRQEAAATMERLEVLGRAASVVGHEISNTLGLLRRLMTSKEDPIKKETIAEQHSKEVDRLQQIADVLLSFSSDELPPRSAHDINEMIRERITGLKKLARPKGLRILFEPAPDVCQATLSQERFVRLLEDLVKNAIEASKTGQRIWIRSQREAQFCKVTVTDEGPGILPEHRPKIFTPFFTTKPDGQGLALAASRKMLQEIGGEIQVENKPDKGVCFTLMIPREDIRNLFDAK